MSEEAVCCQHALHSSEKGNDFQAAVYVQPPGERNPSHLLVGVSHLEGNVSQAVKTVIIYFFSKCTTAHRENHMQFSKFPSYYVNA